MSEYKFKTGLLDRRRTLLIEQDRIAFESGDSIGKEFSTLNKADITDFKHGMDWIVWYKFTVGRAFSVTVKGKNNHELKIVFKSYFGLNSQYDEMYKSIVNDVWEYYHQDIVNRYLDVFNKGEELQIQGLRLNSQGVQLTGQASILSWEKISIKEYYRYFAVYDRDDPKNHFRVSYNEYGTEILWSAVKTILKEKGSLS